MNREIDLNRLEKLCPELVKQIRYAITENFTAVPVTHSTLQKIARKLLELAEENDRLRKGDI